MPHLPFAQNILRLRFLGTVNNQNWASIHYARFTGPPPGSADLNTVATQCITAWQNAFATLCGAHVSLRVVQAIDLSSELGAIGSHSQAVPGTRAGSPAMPNNAACVASYAINRRYRGGHPRSYWPLGLIADTVSGNLWTAAFLPLASNGASSFVGNINAILYANNPLQHGCLSYYEHDPGPPPQSVLRGTPQFFPTQSVVVHSRVDSMRRRLGKELA